METASLNNILFLQSII